MIWVNGSEGLLGRYVYKKLSEQFHIIGTDIEVDVTKSLTKFMKKYKPNIVVHCAAMANVDQCEKNKLRAFETNAYVLEQVYKFNPNILMIYPSTASVFYRKKTYVETDTTWPRCSYALSKVAGENYARQFPRHYILRLSNLYGCGQQNFGSWIYASARKFVPPVKVVTDMKCQPTYAAYISLAVRDLIEKVPPFGTYHLATPGKITRQEFAKKLYKQMNIKKPYPFEPVTLKSLKLPAKRPVHAVLDCSKWINSMGKIPSHEHQIEAFLEEIKYAS